MVGGIWMENTTCARCRHRHPPQLTCQQAQAHAARYGSKLTEHLIQSREAEAAVQEALTKTVMDALYRGCRVSMVMDELLIEGP